MHIPELKTLAGADTLGFLAQHHQMLIGAEWHDASSGETIPVFDPATAQPIAYVPAGGAAEINLAVTAARKAFASGPWPRMSETERGKLIWKLADILAAHERELAEIEAIDTGRPIYETAMIDAPGSVSMLRYMAGWAGKINGETMPVSMPGDFHTYSLREPVGVVGIIVPWNYPLQLAVSRMAPALAAGCTIILKPAEQTPLGTIRLGQLIQQAGFPPGVVNVVTGYGETAGAALSEHPDVDAISFTGSTETGKLIVKAAASNLKRVILELGGKSPAIIFADADVELAVEGISRAIFMSAGQVCTASSRLFVHEKLFDKVIAGITAAARSLKLGHGMDPATRLGPLVSAEQQARVTHFLNTGRAEGAEFVTGGNPIAGAGYFVEPTIMVNTRAGMSVYDQEIFGPVLCAQPFDGSLESAAALANDTVYGLQASVWTRDLAIAHKMARLIKSGNVCINAHNFFDPHFPMGGYKQSGWGRAQSFAAIEHYTEIKGVAARL